MTQSNEKYRIAFSLADMESLLSLIQGSPDFMMENLELVSKIEKAKRKAEFNLLAPAYTATKAGNAVTRRVEELAGNAKKAKFEELQRRQLEGEQLTKEETEELVTYKAENHLELTEAEQQIFNALMMKSIGL